VMETYPTWQSPSVAPASGFSLTCEIRRIYGANQRERPKQQTDHYQEPLAAHLGAQISRCPSWFPTSLLLTFSQFPTEEFLKVNRIPLLPFFTKLSDRGFKF
jgi:hypothetical protein